MEIGKEGKEEKKGKREENRERERVSRMVFAYPLYYYYSSRV
jgi:hypothetical protein